MAWTRQCICICVVLDALSCGAQEICDTRKGKRLDFSRRGLSSIPSQIPSDVTVLGISGNDIHIVLNKTMEKLSKLKSLDLSLNRIQKLDPLAFFGLGQLCFLDLRGNKLSMTHESFPLPVFTHIPDLKILHIEGNVFPGFRNTTYPDQTLKNLKDLQFFYADTFPGLRLGEGFSSLTHLQTFQSQHGIISTISNHTFLPFANLKLKKLILSQCDISAIETGAFVHLEYLEFLDLSFNPYLGLIKALDSLYGLQSHNMTDLKLARVNGPLMQFKDSMLDGTNAKYLKNICIANLDLSGNKITNFDMAFLASFQFPECFRRISIYGHHLLNIKRNLWILFEMTRFHHLEYLDMSGDNCHSAVKKRRNVRANNSYKRKITFNLIRSLKVLKGSCGVTQKASWYFTTPLSLGKTDSLRVVDMSFNGIYHCTGLLADSGLENITVLNISGWDCSQLSPAFLSKLPGLEVLEVELLRLNKGLESDKGGIFLRQQEKLKTLNMAKNELTDLHPELFSSLGLVQSLNLANNKFMFIPRALRSMTSLTYLDISYNSLVTLDTADREWLEQVSYLNLYGNPLSCICPTLDFVLWLLDTDIHIELENKLTCTLKDGTKTLLANLNSTVKDMKVACVSRFWLTFSVSISAVSVLAVCISVVYYRYRHNIKYWFLTKCRRGATYEEVPLDDNEYDAFVAYNHEDYRWACHTLREFLEDDHRYRLCLHHRDFPAGESIQGNIVDAINTSRKIILVISKKYLACNWAEFEIQMAGMRMVQSGRNDVVITIMLEEIPVREMPRALLRMWRNITFLLWTNDPGDQNLFWGRLSEAMART